MTQAIHLATVIFLGLILGSFTSALSYRVARQLPWRAGRSACPACHAALGPLDLVPVLSWLALRGRCRHCGAKISVRYPLTELGVLAGCLGLYAGWGFSVPGFIGMAALPFLATLFLVDLEQLILPDAMQIILAVLGAAFTGVLAWAATRPAATVLDHTAAAVIFAALIWVTGKAVSLIRRREALGFGDVKFMAVTGLWLGLEFLPIFLIASGVAGIICGLVWRRLGRGSVFPFGPALILWPFMAAL